MKKEAAITKALCGKEIIDHLTNDMKRLELEKAANIIEKNNWCRKWCSSHVLTLLLYRRNTYTYSRNSSKFKRKEPMQTHRLFS